MSNDRTLSLSTVTATIHAREFTNHIHSSAIDQTLTVFEENNIPFERARDARQQASHAHNLEETPKFAKSIERRALGISHTSPMENNHESTVHYQQF